MLSFEAGNIEKQSGGSISAEDASKKERLLRYISSSFNIPEEQLEDEAVLRDIAMQLQRESNPFMYQHSEDTGAFAAGHINAEEELAHNREPGKNSFYNRLKAKEYIDTYWKNYNPAYPAFHGGGGDCANFISQVLYAGGMPWVDDGVPSHYTWFTNWYCKPGATNQDGDTRVSLSWKVAAAFRKNWEKRAAKLLVISYKDAINSMKDLALQVYVGDPVQFCYADGTPYHTLIVTGYTWDEEAGVSDIVLASHTIDSNKRSLYNTMLKYPMNYHLRFYIIKEGE